MTAHFHNLVQALQSIYDLLQLEETGHKKKETNHSPYIKIKCKYSHIASYWFKEIENINEQILNRINRWDIGTLDVQPMTIYFK
jgi:hypothetical protein